MVTDIAALDGGSLEESLGTAEEPVLRAAEDVLESGDAPTPEEMAVMLEEEPEALVRIWNEKATILLDREADFLDNPSMSQAGERLASIGEVQGGTPPFKSSET